MELLFRSVARAGGIEVPPEVRFFQPPERMPWEYRFSTKFTGALLGLTRRLVNRLAAQPAPGSGRTLAHP